MPDCSSLLPALIEQQKMLHIDYITALKGLKTLSIRLIQSKFCTALFSKTQLLVFFSVKGLETLEQKSNLTAIGRFELRQVYFLYISIS